MPSIVTQGVVLRFANYREHDRMLTILSPQYGRIDALSRGCRKPKSSLMPVSELFVSGEFVLYQAHEHFTLTSATLRDSFYPLRLEPYRDGLLLAALETHPQMRRKGYAVKLILEVMTYAKELSIYSHVSKKNIASLRTHEKCGFERIMEYAVYADGSVNDKSYTFCYRK